MTETEEMKVEKELLMRYLYAELNKKEKEKLEEAFFLDDELFFEVMDLENELVDQYARGLLSTAEAARFEKSLEKFPDRKQKVLNAGALQTYIEEETESEISVPVPAAAPVTESTFWEKLSAFFNFQSPVFGPAAAGLMLIFGIMGILLFLDNRQKSGEIARLQNEQGNVELWQQRENELKEQLNGSNQRLEDLKNQLANSEEDKEGFTNTLIAEQQKIQELERTLIKLRQEINKPVPTPKSSSPTFASILLNPYGGNKGGGGDPGKIKTASVGENTKKLAINMTLPDNLKKGELYTVKLNEQPFLKNVSLDGKKSLSLTIPIKNLSVGGPNKLTVTDSTGQDVTSYIFNVEKPQD